MESNIQLFTSSLETFLNIDVSKKKNNLFFITDTKQLYFEDKLYNEPIIISLDLNIDNPSIGTMYYNESDGNIYIYDGTDFKLAIKSISTVQNLDPNGADPISGSAVINYILQNPITFLVNAIKDISYDINTKSIRFTKSDNSKDTIFLNKILSNVIYDESTGIMSFKDIYNETISKVNIFDNYIVSGKYVLAEAALVFTLKDGSTVKIPATDLINIYTSKNGVCTETTIENTPTGNIIRINILLSKQTGNILTINDNGFYIQYTEFNNKLDLVTKNYTDYIVRAKSDGMVEVKHNKPTMIGSDTLYYHSDTVIATEKAVSNFSTGLADKIFLNKTELSSTDHINKVIPTNMLKERMNHCMIESDKYTLSVGGYSNTSGNNADNSTEKYFEGVWSMSAATLNKARTKAASIFYDNKIFGGEDGGRSHADGEIYDFLTDSWSMISGSGSLQGSIRSNGATSSTQFSLACYMTFEYEDFIQKFDNGVYSLYDINLLEYPILGNGMAGGDPAPDTVHIKGMVFGGQQNGCHTQRLSDSISLDADTVIARNESAYLGDKKASSIYIFGGADMTNNSDHGIDSIEKYNNSVWSMNNNKLLVPRVNSFAYSKFRNKLYTSMVISGGSGSDNTKISTTEEIISYNPSNIKPTLYKQTGSATIAPSELLIFNSYDDMKADFESTTIKDIVSSDKIISKDSGDDYNNFVTTSQVNIARWNAGAGISEDPKEKYVYGGYGDNGKTYLSSMEKCTNNIWNILSSNLNIGRHGLAYSGNSLKSFCAGGFNADVSTTRSSEIFDEPTNVWKTGPDFNGYARGYIGSSIPNESSSSMFIIVGGCQFTDRGTINYYSDVEYLDTDLQNPTWVTINELPSHRYDVGCFGDSLASLGAIGGISQGYTEDSYSRDFDKNTTNGWIKKPELLVGAMVHSILGTEFNLLLLGKGYGNKKANQKYNGTVWSMYEYDSNGLDNFTCLGTADDPCIISGNLAGKDVKMVNEIKSNNKSENIPNEEFISKYFSWKEI